jgi:hypothetical protein
MHVPWQKNDGDFRPAPAEVDRPKDTCSEIVEAMPINGDVSCTCVEMGSVDHGDLAPIAETFRRHVYPSSSAIAREVN